jgi:4-amino-4-deoxy-L-arabinose transferase-like glycosyltransferase
MRGWWRAEQLILLLVLLVRLVHLVGILDDPLAATPRMDPRYHDTWARAIAGGDLTFDGPFFRAPFYAYLLGGLYAISDGSIAFARALQLALGLVTVILVIRIGRRTVGERAALLGGALWGVYPLALRVEGDLLLEGPFLVLAMGALLQHLRALERPSRRAWLATGLLLGLAAITRPNILVYAVTLPLTTALVRGLRSRQAAGPTAPLPAVRMKARTEMAMVAVGILLPILPVALHNGLAGHDFTPIATQAGVNFYIGNNPRSDGFTAILPGSRATWWGGHDDAVELAERGRNRPLRPSEVSDYWLEQGLRFIREEPAAAIRLFARKLYLFWWGAEISNNEHIYFLRRYSWPLRLSLGHWGIYFPFGLVGPLALVGMALAWRRLGRRVIPLLAYVVLFMGSVVLFFVCARFRLPVVPVLLLFAGFAALELVERARRGRRRVTAVAVALLLLVIGLNCDPYGLRPAVFGSQALSYIDLGVHYVNAGDTVEAEKLMRKAAELDPGHPAPHAWLGRIALERGDMVEAEAALRMATRGDPVLFRDVVTRAQRDLGRLAMLNGWPDRALAVYQAALSLDPGDAASAAGAGVAAAALGDTTTALRYIARALELDPQSATARAALLRLGRASRP